MRARCAAIALPIALLVAACGGPGSSPAPSAPTPASTDVAAGPTSPAPPTEPGSEPAPTAVPGGQTIEPGPPATHKPTTTITDWGVILDAVPDDFPRYPGAATVDSPDEPVSQALETADGIDVVATWYRDALDGAGYATLDLSDPLEDGSRVLDSQADIPECRVQTTFRPAGGSTMITVLFAAGCVAIGG